MLNAAEPNVEEVDNSGHVYFRHTVAERERNSENHYPAIKI